MVDPRILCQKHLCGCHLEMHMFIGHIKRKRKVDGFLKNNCLEPLLLKKVHDEMANEMLDRGYNHKTPLTDTDFTEAISYLEENQLNCKINEHESLKELIGRCDVCKERYELLQLRM